jgi:gliding motility-associated protein GldL
MRPGSKAWKKFMAKLYGFGAAIVIVGAMFKIMHWPGAGPMLVVGLSTEAVIFLFSAFEPLHEEVDWSLVYPELAGMHDEEGDGHGKKAAIKGGGLTEQFDKMLEEAKIGPELIESLGSGMRTLSDQASKLNNITDASVATQDYVNSVKSAAKNVSGLSSAYSTAAESLMGLSLSNQDGASFGEQLGKVSKNLSALNAVYELQLQGSNDHLRATTLMHQSIEQLMTNLNNSVEDTKRYKEEISTLANNLSQLNTIYGNMLNAMGRK